jgi:hypothetical protein
LTQHANMPRLWMLCLDDWSFEFIVQLDDANLVPIRLSQLEHDDPEFFAAKSNRSLIEYYFTCTPILPLYILRKFPHIDRITYLDADLFFFSSLDPVFKEISGSSISIIEHRFAPHVEEFLENGRFNVGFLSFRNDEEGRRCLQTWRSQCIAWCYDRVEADRFADQKYLDVWPEEFHSVKIVEHKGANVAPWNIGRYTLSERQGHAYVDELPLVFYHFHSLKRRRPWLFDPSFAAYGIRRGYNLIRSVYRPYVQMLLKLDRICGDVRTEGNLKAHGCVTRGEEWAAPRGLGGVAKHLAGVLGGNYIAVIGDRVLDLPF